MNPPLPAAKLKQFCQLRGWEVTRRGHAIQKSFPFADFAQAWGFLNRIAHQAEAMNHHPDMSLSWGNVTITLTTHEISGVTLEDKRLAEYADSVYAPEEV